MTRMIVILAGGEGRRIGGSKPMRLLAGRTLLAHAIDYASGLADVIAVSARDPGQVGGVAAQLILDDPRWKGPLGGMAAALAFAGQRGEAHVLTIPCDSPFLPPDLVSRLEEALVPSVGAALASSGGRPHPVCGLWRTAALHQLENYAAGGGSSLLGFAEHIGYAAAEWPDRPRDPFFNINRDADLELAESWFSA